MTRVRPVGCAVLLAAMLAASAARAAGNDTAESPAAALQLPVAVCGVPGLDDPRLASYYPTPGLLWIDGGLPSTRARQLRAVLAAAEDDGLSPSRYRLDAIDAHWPARDARERACFDLLLTAAFDRYSRDLHSGRANPLDADPTWTLRPVPFDPPPALRAAGSESDFAALLESLAPPHAGYRALRTTLARYRRLTQKGGWPALPPGVALAPGDRHPQVTRLRERLRAEGDLSVLSLSFGGRYDPALVDAVQRFQRRHGLAADGIVGPHTRAALNVPAGARIAQLERALERWRWLPRDLGEHYVLVNTAGFELAVIEAGRTVLGMRVIVGTPDQVTPSFAATLESMVINPYWYVPARIARDRLLPKEQRHPGYLAARGFHLFEVANGEWRELDPSGLDWNQTDGGLDGLRLRQEPGPKNLMGRLSFALPNPFDVFLHDTPDRTLFGRERRSFSEGCVRIENAMALALHLLRTMPEWTEARIQEEIDALRHQTLRLPERIPVYVLYLPAWVDDAGTTHFREDHYRREAVLATVYPDR